MRKVITRKTRKASPIDSGIAHLALAIARQLVSGKKVSAGDALDDLSVDLSDRLEQMSPVARDALSDELALAVKDSVARTFAKYGLASHTPIEFEARRSRRKKAAVVDMRGAIRETDKLLKLVLQATRDHLAPISDYLGGQAGVDRRVEKSINETAKYLSGARKSLEVISGLLERSASIRHSKRKTAGRNDQIFAKIYKKYSAKDYFGMGDTLRTLRKQQGEDVANAYVEIEFKKTKAMALRFLDSVDAKDEREVVGKMKFRSNRFLRELFKEKTGIDLMRASEKVVREKVQEFVGG